jgi:hypothetical protein
LAELREFARFGRGAATGRAGFEAKNAAGKFMGNGPRIENPARSMIMVGGELV